MVSNFVSIMTMIMFACVEIVLVALFVENVF